MKKLLLLSFFLSLGGFYLSAQNTVSGIVTDKKGNPIPGAKVEIKGGTESTITELDGTFTLETKTPAQKVKVYYVGMQAKEQKVKPDMLIKMSDSSWWKTAPDKYQWLASAQVAFPENGISNPSFGLMLGRMKKLGWYVKGVYSKPQSTTGEYNYTDTHWTTGKTKQSFWAAFGGGIFRLGSPIHLYVGLGYIERKTSWQLADGSYYEYIPDTYNGFAFDIGLMFRIKNFFISGGVMGADNSNKIKINETTTDEGETEFIGNFGIGFCF